MKAFAALALTAAGLLAGAPALAQTGYNGLDMGSASSMANAAPSPERRPESWAPSVQGEMQLANFAVCAVSNHPKIAGWVLEATPASDDEKRRALKLFGSGCASNLGEFKMRSEVVRWALAERLYVTGTGPLPAAMAATAVAASGDAYALGKCAAGRDPQAADAFVRTVRRSPEEAAALQKLQPAIAACAGVGKLNLSGAQIHGVLAEALLRMRGPSAPGTN